MEVVAEDEFEDITALHTDNKLNLELNQDYDPAQSWGNSQECVAWASNQGRENVMNDYFIR